MGTKWLIDTPILVAVIAAIAAIVAASVTYLLGRRGQNFQFPLKAFEFTLKGHEDRLNRVSNVRIAIDELRVQLRITEAVLNMTRFAPS